MGAPKPLEINGHILLPVRAIFEALGATVDYSAPDHKVTATLNGNTLVLVIGSKNAYVNGELRVMDVAAKEVGGRVFIPVRFAAESLNGTVDYVESSRTAFIKTR